MDVCEYCGEPAECDVLIQGDYLRVCRRCLNDDMVVVEKPTKQQVEWSYKRPTVRQILSGMSGVPRNPIERIPNPAPTLSTLRTSVKESAIKKRLINMKADSPDQGRIVKEREPKSPQISSEQKAKIEEEDEFLDI